MCTGCMWLRVLASGEDGGGGGLSEDINDTSGFIKFGNFMCI